MPVRLSEAKKVFLSFPEFLPGQWSFLGFWGAYRVFWVLMIFWRVNGVFLSWRVSWNISLAQPLECRVQKKKFVQAKSLQWCETVEHNLHISCSFEHGWHSQTLFPSMKGRSRATHPSSCLHWLQLWEMVLGNGLLGMTPLSVMTHLVRSFSGSDCLASYLAWQLLCGGDLSGKVEGRQAMGAGGCMKGLEGNKK